MEFEWDLSKEVENIRKHGVAFAEAVKTFFDPDGLQLVDHDHSRVEQRFYWIGKSGTGRILTTRFTRRGQRLRIIGSAEWRKFRRIYETAKSK